MGFFLVAHNSPIHSTCTVCIKFIIVYFSAWWGAARRQQRSELREIRNLGAWLWLKTGQRRTTIGVLLIFYCMFRCKKNNMVCEKLPCFQSSLSDISKCRTFSPVRSNESNGFLSFSVSPGFFGIKVSTRGIWVMGTPAVGSWASNRSTRGQPLGGLDFRPGTAAWTKPNWSKLVKFNYSLLMSFVFQRLSSLRRS